MDHSNSSNGHSIESVVRNSKYTRKNKTWPQIKSVVEFSRKLIQSLNCDIPSNINFREYLNKQTGQFENRVYFLASNQKREITIKYLNLKQTSDETQSEERKLVGVPIFNNLTQMVSVEKQQLTKEEQLLRERKRCSFNGITSYSLDQNSNRLVFSERSELFYFDDMNGEYNSSLTNNDEPNLIETLSKGAIDVQICPVNSNLISYVLNDNLWMQDLVTKRFYQLTNTENPVKSGVPSYAVQEEFNRYTGYWWQPSAQTNVHESTCTYRIIYEEIDDSGVDQIYITPSCEDEFGYDSYRYPKAGTPNSKIHLKMVEITFFKDIEKSPVITRKKMHRSFYELFDWYEYLVRGDWVPNGKFFWVQIYDRLQTRAVTLLVPLSYFVEADFDNASLMQTSFSEESSKHIVFVNEQQSNTWINSHNVMHFLNESEATKENNISFITANDETGFLHLYLYRFSLLNLTSYIDGVSKATPISKIQLSKGDWCIENNDNITVDEINHLVYFTAYMNPIESQLFVIDYLNPNGIKQLTKSGFSHTVSINKKCNLFVTICSNLDTPYKTYLYEIQNQQSDSVNLRDQTNGLVNLRIKLIAQILSREETKMLPMQEPHHLETNPVYSAINNVLNLNLDSCFLSYSNDESVLVQHLFKSPQLFTFQTSDNIKLYGMIYFPFNYEQGTIYPTVLYVYGGPRAQIVTNAYKSNKYSRFNVLALLGYCVVVIDSRGSDYRGQVFESYLNRKMGTVEINDQVLGLEHAAATFKCIDLSRVAIFGWSYGGYMALMGLCQKPEVFKVAISGAPVTSWELYDTAYTERYMGIPDENKEAYYKGSVLSCAKAFPDEENRLLIIHGMIDENVHFIHTRKLINALIKEGKPYRLQIYPNERHGIRSPDASLHCDINLYSFLEQNL